MTRGLTTVFSDCLLKSQGGILPYIGYTGMCHWRGYGFQAICSGKGYGFHAIWSGRGYGFQAIWSGIGSSNHRRLVPYNGIAYKLTEIKNN